MRMAESLSDALPDLVLLVQRDGVLLAHLGGRSVPALVPPEEAIGQRLEFIFPQPVADCIRRSVRRAITQRGTLDLSLSSLGVSYEMRASAKGPDCAICVIRSARKANAADDASGPDDLARPQLHRRGFLRRFRDTLAQAAIQEKPAALALIHLDGVVDIAHAVDARISEQVLSSAILRLSDQIPPEQSEAAGQCYLGQLNADLLALVMECADRDTIEARVSQVCASLRAPVLIGDSAFQLTPYAGIAQLGRDGTSPKSLLENARSAAAEARRSNSAAVFFFTDTLKLRSLARLDVARELREAIANREIRLRYIGRHDLATGRLVAQVGYLRWNHRLRGELAAAEFLGIAETTGLATALSRAILQGLREDFAAMEPQLDAEARISFGALRHHMLQEEFVDDIRRFIAEGGVPASRLELRISERAFATMDLSAYESLSRLGVQIVVDEVGRGFTSLDRLARAPIWGLQLDRAWVTALRTDSVALKMCRAGICAAAALKLTPIATGVDDAAQRAALIDLGCKQGSGDLYREAAGQFDTSIMRRASQAAG
jgi:EAL domain-containing protein (putative c-di-GMP-specific phosphodiesterase class I)/GGDEF domain-containing protein